MQWGQEAQAGRPIPLTASVLRVRYVQERVTWPLIDSRPHLPSSSGTEVRPESGLRRCLLSGVFTQTGMGLTLALKVVLAFSSGPWTGLSALAGCSLQVHFVLPVRIDCVCTHTYLRVALFGVFYKSGQIKC